LADLFEIERWILSWGSHAKVLGPAKLKNSIRKHAEAIAANG
jgi:predicted DNA-binding transcriptional regulator YafY